MHVLEQPALMLPSVHLQAHLPQPQAPHLTLAPNGAGGSTISLTFRAMILKEFGSLTVTNASLNAVLTPTARLTPGLQEIVTATSSPLEQTSSLMEVFILQ